MPENQDLNPYLESQNIDALLVSRAEIQQSFVIADEWMNETTLDPSFRAYCKEWQVTPGDKRNPDYWRALATYGYESAATAREQNGPSLETDSYELVTATTAYIFEQNGMNHGGFNSYEEREAARQTTSYFNGLIRRFGENYPETDAKDILGPLTKIVSANVDQMNLRQAGTNYLKQSIRGAQHELAFGQILSAGSVKFRPASQEEDLHGIDYVVDDGRGKALFVDVKASLSEVEARGSAGVFAVKRDRDMSRVIMFSCIRDDELGGKFWLSSEVAQEKAPVVMAQMQKASRAA